MVDDGTVARLDEQSYRWTAADPSLRWLRMNSAGLDVEIEDVSEEISALAVQGPLSRDVLEAATEMPWGDLGYFGRRAGRVGRIPVDVSRTGYTGDLGYEVWVESSAGGGALGRSRGSRDAPTGSGPRGCSPSTLRESRRG